MVRLLEVVRLLESPPQRATTTNHRSDCWRNPVFESVEQFHRRNLPKGYDDEQSPFFIPRPIQSFYVCVSAHDSELKTRLAKHNAVEVAALDWMEKDLKGKGTIPW